MSKHKPGYRRPRSTDELQRELIRLWRRELSARKFTDEQAARLILTKFLYIRGSLRG